MMEKSGNTKKKGINGNKKGKGFERLVAKRLDEIFGPYCNGQKFKRVPSSGAHTGGKNIENVAHMPPSAIRTLTSDLIVPENFRYAIECKSYNKIDLYPLLVGSAAKHPIIKWMSQLQSGLTNEIKEKTGFIGGILVMKGNSMPWLIALTMDDLKTGYLDTTHCQSSFCENLLVIKTIEFGHILIQSFEEFFSDDFRIRYMLNKKIMIY